MDMVFINADMFDPEIAFIWNLKETFPNIILDTAQALSPVFRGEDEMIPNAVFRVI